MSNNMVFAAYDGDNAGRQAGRAILADNVEALHEVSSRIEIGHDVVKRWVESQGGTFISGGGDEGIFQIPVEAVKNIEQLRNDYQYAADLTMTVGIGNTLSEAGKALMVGKFRGKNTAVQYDPSIEDEIRQTRERLEQGTASAEEQKLGEAYLKPETGDPQVKKNVVDDDCPFCKDLQEEDPCPYCQEADQNTADDECPYCKDMDRKDNGDECPFCQDVAHDESQCGTSDAKEITGDDHSVDQTAGPTVKEPTTQSAEAYEEKALNPPGMDKPNPDEEPKVGLASPAISEVDNQKDTPSNRALDVKDGKPFERVPNAIPDDVERDATQDILNQLDEEGSNPTDEGREEVENTDVVDLPVGDNADENISRPEDYRSDVPGDMGLGEEEEQGPDLGGLVQEDLDVHADQMQKEKVVGMVSEALEGFKGCKPILEKAKEQAPQLYQSSLAMLRAMIEMAKMLGLSDGSESAEEAVGEPADPNWDGQQGTAEVSDPNSPMPQEEQVMGDSWSQADDETHDWQQPFKPHPAHGQSAAQEDADEDPKLKSQ